MRAIAAVHPDAPIRIERAPPGSRLGGLRNIAIARARGEWICQWDDDDRYHPERLQLQWQHAMSERADVNYLVDQLHWFSPDNVLFWEDWNGDPYPINVIPGTILARRDVMPPYPDIGKNEDTSLTHALARADASKTISISRLRGAGWCYIYRFHGDNTWDATHHRAVYTYKRMPPARLLPRLSLLEERLRDYWPALPSLRVRLDTGAEYVMCGEPATDSPRREA